MLDKENYYAPDSISPSPKPGMTRFFSKQAASDKDNASPPLSQRVAVLLVPIPISFMFLNLRLIITIVLSSWLYLNFKARMQSIFQESVAPFGH